MRTKGKVYYFTYKDITLASDRVLLNSKLLVEVGDDAIRAVLKVFSSALIRRRSKKRVTK